MNKEQGRENTEQLTLIQRDSGQGYTKLAVSRICCKELDQDICRIPGTCVVFSKKEDEEEENENKKRHSWDEGLEGWEQIEDWGARKIILLAVVHKV